MKIWFVVGSGYQFLVEQLFPYLESIKEHQFELIQSSQISFTVSNHLPCKIWLDGEPVSPPDAFMAIDLEDQAAEALAMQLEFLGVLAINTVQNKHNAINKLTTYQILAKAGVPVIKTLLFHKNQSVNFLVEELGLPLVLKPNDGFGGEGVRLVHTKEAVQEELDNCPENELVLAQQYIESSKGRDLRVITVGYEAVFAARRTAQDPNEFRSNLKTGGSAQEVELTDEICDLCYRTSKAIGLDFAGIDLLYLENGFVVGEVNSSAGYKSWLGKKNLFPTFLKLLKKRWIQQDWPYWCEQELWQKAAHTQLAQLLVEMDDVPFHKAVNALYKQCQKTQETVLLEMLQNSKDTQFGKKYGLADITSAKEYQKRVPLLSWEDFAPYAQRLEEGEKDILFPGKSTFFYRTSGTSGDFKYIPESKRGTFAQQAISRARIMQLMQAFGKQPPKRVFFFINKPTLDESVGGIPRGTASGRFSEIVDESLRPLFAYPPRLVNEFEGEELLYMLLRCTLPFDDMSAIVGNNPLMLQRILNYGKKHSTELIEDIRTGKCRYALSKELSEEIDAFLKADEKRANELQSYHDAGTFTPRYYWPNMQVAAFWLGGSVGNYVNLVKPDLGEDILFWDVGYGASEGKFNIPTKPETPSGVLSSFSVFFEFLPQDGTAPLLAHEVEDGQYYELVITTYGGLYRYRTHDLVCVDGFLGNTPNIYFISKQSDVANLAQEKIPGPQLARILNDASAALGYPCHCLQIYPDPSQVCYRVYMELESQTDMPEGFEAKLESALCESLPIAYRDRPFNPLRVQLMKQGWGEHLLGLYAKNQTTLAQVKVPVVLKDFPETDWQKT